MRTREIVAVGAVALLLALGGCNAKQAGKSSVAKPAVTGKSTQASEPTADPIALVETNRGNFKIKLFRKEAPITAGNFIKLVKQHFYDGLTFHRVVPGFVIQGGDPKGDGSGGPGWTIPLEIVKGLNHDCAGMVAMARTQDPNSAGSQFYITLAPAPSLDGKYAVFGQVVEGLNVVLAMGQVATDSRSRPLKPLVIKRITLERR